MGKGVKPLGWPLEPHISHDLPDKATSNMTTTVRTLHSVLQTLEGSEGSHCVLVTNEMRPEYKNPYTFFLFLSYS